MDGCYCSYCGKSVSWNKIIDFGFYLIGDYACKKNARKKELNLYKMKLFHRF